MVTGADVDTETTSRNPEQQPSEQQSHKQSEQAQPQPQPEQQPQPQPQPETAQELVQPQEHQAQAHQAQEQPDQHLAPGKTRRGKRAKEPRAHSYYVRTVTTRTLFVTLSHNESDESQQSVTFGSRKLRSASAVPARHLTVAEASARIRSSKFVLCAVDVCVFFFIIRISVNDSRF